MMNLLSPISLVVLAAAAGRGVAGQPSPIGLETVVGGFAFPVEIAVNPDDKSDRLYVVEQGGLVKIVERPKGPNGGAPYVLPTPFLDVSSKVSFTGAEFEEGLLGLAFKGDYFYINYTTRQGQGANRIKTVVYRFALNGDVTDPETGELVIEYDQPKIYHNGGTLVFGPDEYLYIASGDGGGANDPFNNGQDLDTLLGKILRIDVDTSPYAIPPDNPFVGREGARGEIWAYGVRNPWKIRFDRHTGDLFIGDVGQSRVEEINFQPASSSGGENYGWDIFQGDECNQLGKECEEPDSYVPPILTYPNGMGDCSVTGGYMYRGRAVNALVDTYVFSDFCSGKIWGATMDDGGNWAMDLLLQAEFLIPTFGEDDDGELYLTDYYGGELYQIVEAP